MTIKLNKAEHPLKGEISIPGDKSISHRAIIFASMTKGQTKIDNFLIGEDCLRTVEIFKQFGVQIEISNQCAYVDSQGIRAFEEPKEPLYFGNSGTTARLMIGLLSSLPFHTVMYGDQHLTMRPMDRVVKPLRKMGAKIDGRGSEGTLLPLAIRGQKLKSIDYKIPMKSAQVKSALLLAGLNTDDSIKITEKAKTRDHTERLIHYYDIDIRQNGLEIMIHPKSVIYSKDIFVPGDISSAAFFLTAAAIVPHSNIVLKSVGINTTRSGFIDVLKAMNSNVEILNKKVLNGEELADIKIEYQNLTSTVISGDIIPRLIDEIPLIALLATQAQGQTIIKDAEELRVKETDRIAAIVENLKRLGADIESLQDGLIINGPTPLKGGKIKSFYDHRMAMMGAIAALITNETVEIDEVKSIDISYPDFFNDLKDLM